MPAGPEGPDALAPLDAEERAAWHALKRLSEIALGPVEQAVFAEAGLSAADFGVLTRLEDLGQGVLQQHELARSIGWHKARLSRHLTRMQRRGLLQRQAKGGRDGVTIGILPAGREALTAARPVHADAIRRHVLGRLRAEEMRLLVDLVQRFECSASP